MHRLRPFLPNAHFGEATGGVFDSAKRIDLEELRLKDRVRQNL
jgi:hypothetical protein